MRQLFFGAMDIELHSKNYDPNGEKTIFQVRSLDDICIHIWT